MSASEADYARNPAFYDDMRRRVEEVRARRKQMGNVDDAASGTDIDSGPADDAEDAE